MDHCTFLSLEWPHRLKMIIHVFLIIFFDVIFNHVNVTKIMIFLLSKTVLASSKTMMIIESFKFIKYYLTDL